MSKERIMLLPPRMMASWRSSEEISLLKLSDTVKESGRIIRSVAIRQQASRGLSATTRASLRPLAGGQATNQFVTREVDLEENECGFFMNRPWNSHQTMGIGPAILSVA